MTEKEKAELQHLVALLGKAGVNITVANDQIYDIMVKGRLIAKGETPQTLDYK